MAPYSTPNPEPDSADPPKNATEPSGVEPPRSAPPRRTPRNCYRTRSVGRLRSSLGRQVGVRLRGSRPPNTRVRPRTGSGDVWIEGVAGSVIARTGSSGTRVSVVGASATIEVGSGSVETLAVGGDRGGGHACGRVAPHHRVRRHRGRPVERGRVRDRSDRASPRLKTTPASGPRSTCRLPRSLWAPSIGRSSPCARVVQRGQVGRRRRSPPPTRWRRRRRRTTATSCGRRPASTSSTSRRAT